MDKKKIKRIIAREISILFIVGIPILIWESLSQSYPPSSPPRYVVFIKDLGSNLVSSIPYIILIYCLVSLIRFILWVIKTLKKK
jgi:ABC-type methionine transport system permease subunit